MNNLINESPERKRERIILKSLDYSYKILRKETISFKQRLALHLGRKQNNKNGKGNIYPLPSKDNRNNNKKRYKKYEEYIIQCQFIESSILFQNDLRRVY